MSRMRCQACGMDVLSDVLLKWTRSAASPGARAGTPATLLAPGPSGSSLTSSSRVAGRPANAVRPITRGRAPAALAASRVIRFGCRAGKVLAVAFGSCITWFDRANACQPVPLASGTVVSRRAHARSRSRHRGRELRPSAHSRSAPRRQLSRLWHRVRSERHSRAPRLGKACAGMRRRPPASLSCEPVHPP